MSKSRKFKGEVNHSFVNRKKKVLLKDKKQKEPILSKDDMDEPVEYFNWEEEGDFEKFKRK